MRREMIKTKSLAARIWLILTALILGLILCISLIYLVVFQKVHEKTEGRNLMYLHNIMKNGEPQEQQIFEKSEFLKESDHFIWLGPEKQESNSPEYGTKYEMDTGPLREEFVKFAQGVVQGEMNGKLFKTSIQGRTYLIVISSVPQGYLISSAPLDFEFTILYIVLFVSCLFIFAGFFASKIIAKNIARPLKELEDFTSRIAAREFGPPVDVHREDEPGRLACAMNKMQEDLRRADQEEKVFLQSISHDLKTPVMVIMSHAEAILDGVYIGSLKNTAQVIKDESARLARKIKQLLYFNTLGYSLEYSDKSEEIDLGLLVSQTVSRIKVVNPDLDWDTETVPFFIRCDADKLTVAIENILDNAIRYADTRISVKLREGSLEIYNDGPSIPQEKLDRIFVNMYKDKTGNFGLGLSISRKIFNYYGASVSVVNRTPGVSFMIRFSDENKISGKSGQ